MFQYYCHKHAFLVSSAIISGQSKLSRDAANNLQAKCDIEFVARNLGGAFFSYPPWQLQALVQFGRWKDILALPLPLRRTVEPSRPGTTTSRGGVRDLVMEFTAAMFHFARGCALAALGNCTQASQEYSTFLLLAPAGFLLALSSFSFLSACVCAYM